MIDYYTDLYKNSLNLKDYKERVISRLGEEEIEHNRLNRLSQVLNFTFGPGQRHLIIGTGTGGLAVELHRQGCLVYGVDPDLKANAIVKLKAQEVGMDENKFYSSGAESLPFSSQYFDFIHCFTVLEHVNKVEKTIQEMIRVTKPKGRIYINTPDYRYPYERHYKLLYPTFLPRTLGYFYLFLRRKPIKFMKGINYVNEKNINKLLYSNNVTWFRIYKSLPDKWFNSQKWFHRILLAFILKLNIPQNQEIIIIKNLSDK